MTNWTGFSLKRIAMPLTKKGRKIKRAMQKTYGRKLGTSIFYASENKGSITDVRDRRFKKTKKSKRGK